MEKDSSIVLGFFAASLCPPIVLASITDLGNGRLDLLNWVIGFFIFLAFTFIVMAFLVFPIFLVANKFNFVKWWSCIIVGLGAGWVVSIFINHRDDVFALPDWFFAYPGAGAGLVFWLVWRLGKEERAAVE